MVRVLSETTGIGYLHGGVAIAWPVDFNLTLKSFEKSLFGVRSLVNFALSSPFENPPQILFVSSIGVFRRTFAEPSYCAEIIST